MEIPLSEHEVAVITGLQRLGYLIDDSPTLSEIVIAYEMFRVMQSVQGKGIGPKFLAAIMRESELVNSSDSFYAAFVRMRREQVAEARLTGKLPKLVGF